MSNESMHTMKNAQTPGMPSSQSTLNNKSANNGCSRCGGTGYIARFNHVEHGICFKCRGRNTVRSRREYKVIESISLVKATKCREPRQESHQWGCEVCGLDEWCGTDGCPLDPQ